MRHLPLVLTLLGAAAPAAAAPATTTATLDVHWDQVRFDVLDTDADDGLTPVVEWEPFAVSIGAEAVAAPQRDTMSAEADDIATASLLATASTSIGSSTASIDDSLITLGTSAAAGEVLPPGPAARSDARVSLSSSLTMSAPGIVLITLPWDLEVGGQTGDSDNRSYVSLQMGGGAYPRSEGDLDSHRTMTSLFVSSELDDTYASSDSLVLPIHPLAPGEKTFFSLHLGASSEGTPEIVVTPPIPEPEAWALMLAGLLLIGERCRRMRGARSKAAAPGSDFLPTCD